MLQAHMDHIVHHTLDEIGESERLARINGEKSRGYGIAILNGHVVLSKISPNDSIAAFLFTISSDDAMALYAEDGPVYARIINQVHAALLANTA